MLKTLLFLGCGAVALGGAMAQETGEEDAQQDVLTVYGTTNPLPAFDYPGQVYVIDREAVELRGASSISDVLRDVPGVDFAGGPRRTGEAPTLRGLGGENILILIDGARQSFISAHDGRFFLDPELVGRAEVVQGPSSALYGSGAVGGVLAFETLDPRDVLEDDESFGARLKVGYQDVNEETLFSATGYGVVGALDVLGNVGSRQSGDITLGSGDDLSSDDEILTGLLKLGYDATPALRLEGSWQHFSNTAIEPNNGQGTLGTGDALLDQDVEKDISTDTFRLGLTFNPQTPLINSEVTAYQTTTEVDEFDATIPRTTIREIETSGLFARNASTFSVAGQELVFTLGAEVYEDEQTGSDDQSTDGSRSGVPDGSSSFVGVFAQLEASFERPFGLPGELLVIPGIRYDSFESESELDPATNEDDATSPRIAASYGPVEWFRVFGSYSEGFRAPSINELYLDGVHFLLPHPVLPGEFVANNFIPNAELIPEKTETVEFGVGVDFSDLLADGDRLQGKISAFDSEIEDLINIAVDVTFEATCFQPPFFPCTAGTTESSNVDAATIDGVEAQLTYDQSRWFATLTYSALDGEDAGTGSDLGTLTPDRTALDAGLKFPEANALLGARIQNAREFERRTADGAGGFTIAEERDGYTVLDFYASWSPEPLDGVRFDLGVDNVFDEDYERVFEGVSQPGRNLKLSVSYQFGR